MRIFTFLLLSLSPIIVSAQSRPASTVQNAKKLLADVSNTTIVMIVAAVVVSLIVLDILKKFGFIPSEVSLLRKEVGEVKSFIQEIRPEKIEFSRTPIGKALDLASDTNRALHKLAEEQTKIYRMASSVLPVETQPFSKSVVGGAVEDLEELVKLAQANNELAETLTGQHKTPPGETPKWFCRGDHSEDFTSLQAALDEMNRNQSKITTILEHISRSRGK